jgi:hypothetical protein
VTKPIRARLSAVVPGQSDPSLAIEMKKAKPLADDTAAEAKLAGSAEPVLVAPAKPSPAERRRRRLERTAQKLGLDWADGWRTDLNAQGRTAAGAWPGTLSEARARVDRYLLASGSRRKLASTDEERVDFARTVYAAAKSHWNENRDREEEE